MLLQVGITWDIFFKMSSNHLLFQIHSHMYELENVLERCSVALLGSGVLQGGREGFRLSSCTILPVEAAMWESVYSLSCSDLSVTEYMKPRKDANRIFLQLFLLGKTVSIVWNWSLKPPAPLKCCKAKWNNRTILR